MTINKNTKLKDFIYYTDLFNVGDSEIKGLFEKLEKKGSPSMIQKKIVPKDLDDLTFAELVEIQKPRTFENILFAFPEVILDIKKNELMNAKAFDVIRFMYFVINEINRIQELFQKIQYKPSPEEISAGINNINNGPFGIIDWYARRMGIIDHDFAAQTTKWIIIYQCLKIDNETAIYGKRLRNEYSKKK